MAGTPVPYLKRFQAFTLYCGCAPFLLPRQTAPHDSFLRHHRDHALAVLALLLGVLFLFFLVVIGLSYAMVWQRDTYESLVLEPRLLDLSWKCFLAWLVFWAFAALHPIFGSTHPIPLITSLAAKRSVRSVTGISTTVLLILAFSLVTVAARGVTLLRHDQPAGKVYLLYEDLDRVPRWIFALGFYRLATTSQDLYGPGNAVYLELTKANIRRALQEGTFLFIGSHGKAMGLITETGWFRPEDVHQGLVNPDLRYVYLTGCDSGAQADAWRNALKPAEVVTHDRLTTVLEHIWWLWVDGPATLRDLPAN
jgi:hypothetical protein